MMALMRLLIFGAIALMALYLGLWWYLRSKARRRIEQDWQDTGRPGDLEAYLEAGMAQYEPGLRRRLVLFVFLLPLAVITLMIYVTNFT